MKTRFDLKVDGPAAVTTSVLTELTNRLADRGDLLHIPEKGEVLEVGRGEVHAEVSGDNTADSRGVLDAILEQIPDALEVIEVV